MAGIYFMSGIMPVTTSLGAFDYIGLTKREQVERLEEHLDRLEADKHSNKLIQNFYNQFGRGRLLTGAIIDCDEYYLNTLEKVYINNLNTFQGHNPDGWNKSRGGERAKNYQIPYAFESGGIYHYGDNIQLFLQQNKNLDPSGVISLLDGKIQSFDGWTKL